MLICASLSNANRYPRTHTMFKLLIVALFATATATSAWKYMSPDHACVDNTLRLTCTFPRMTSYDKAFTMAASLPACRKGIYD